MTESRRRDLSRHAAGLATGSLGMHPNHGLESKLQAIAKAGFPVVELRVGDYIAWVRHRRPELPASTCPVEWGAEDEPDPSDDIIWQALYDEADELKRKCKEMGLTLGMLQPLNQFDGWPEGNERGEWSRRKAERWLPWCSKLGVEFLQVGSNDLAEANGGDEKTVTDLRWLADLGARQNPPVKIAYEQWSFSHRVNSWEHTWDLVRKADHPNLGLCMDVAQWCQNWEYGWDVTTGKGWEETSYLAMLDRVRQVPAEKIFYVEVSDLVAPDPPLGKGSPFDAWVEENRPDLGPRFSWIWCGRPVPLVGRHAGKIGPEGVDFGARVVSSIAALLDTGFSGPIVLEFFEALRQEQGDPNIPKEYAQASAKSWKLLTEALMNQS